MVPPPEALPVPEQAAPAPRSLVTRLRPLLPWLSLVTGIAGGVLMDRGPKRAAGVALGCGRALAHAAVVARVRAARPERGGPRRRFLLRARATLVAARDASLVQLTLFFALPFYYKAASLHLGHIVFMGALGRRAPCRSGIR